MSDDAKTLMYWVSNANACVADNESDALYCSGCARAWAAAIIAASC